MEVAIGLHVEILVPTLTYGCETFVWYAYGRLLIRAGEIDHLQSAC